MGVKTACAGITYTAGGRAKAQQVGLDIDAHMAEINLGITEIQTKINFLINNVLTPAGGESSNITTLNTQLTALS
jgi:hypothetical protein